MLDIILLLQLNYFWNHVNKNKKAKFVTINFGECEIPNETKDRSLSLSGDADEIKIKYMN